MRRRCGRAPVAALATVLASLAVLVLSTETVWAAKAPRVWPPDVGRGRLFVHYGEEHWDDEDGERLLSKVVADTARYTPDVVVLSADKSSDGTLENLRRWKHFMRPYDRAGIPYFAAVGNHDRKAHPGFPEGVDPAGDLTNYKNVFSDQPYPWGDARPPRHRAFSPNRRPADDPDGASSHYAFDFGPVRWIVIDNSCFSIINCDPLQNPPFPNSEGDAGQYDFLRREAAEAEAKGKLVFVNMHMPTQDDRPGHTEPTPSAHTMGEGTSPDNQLFEQVAAQAGVDGVFTGHIKGQWKYRAEGIPYFIDGGAGGELYVGPAEDVGVDYGYWHGYRLVRVTRDREWVTDAVPIFVKDGITVSGPTEAQPGEELQFTATGEQPTEHGPEVEALELRDPDPSRPNASKLPTPARIWTSSNPDVLKPLEADSDDPRRNRRSQTVSGRFRARCPGRSVITITSGWEHRDFLVKVRDGESTSRSCKRKD